MPLSRVRFLWPLLWLAWVAVIVAIVLPWGDFQGHTHWEKVGWIPFVTPPVKPLDIVGNMVLYVPFGYCFSRVYSGRTAGIALLMMAAILSVGTECTQLYSHWRFPSLTDVTMNLAGTFTGLYFARRASRRA